MKETHEFRSLAPQLVFVEGFSEYNYTFHVEYGLIAESRVLKKLESYSLSLFNFDIGDRLVFFSGLIDNVISGADLHRLFACLRSIYRPSISG